MPAPLKKFYTEASFQEESHHCVLTLDGKPFKTPQKKDVRVPTSLLAKEICAEWNAQEDVIKPHTMPLYSILTTAIDKGEEERSALTQNILPYINGDLLSYQTNYPEDLGSLQKKKWGHALSLFEDSFQTIPVVTFDIQAIEQSKAHHKAIADFIDNLNQWEFTCFHILVSLTDSPILACLALRGKVSAETIMDIICIEDNFYAEKYEKHGEGIPDIEKKKKQSLFQDIEACFIFLKYLA